MCPKCGNRRAYELANLRRWQCAGCRYQVSLTAGTILHNTKTPLAVWFCSPEGMKRMIAATKKRWRLQKAAAKAAKKAASKKAAVKAAKKAKKVAPVKKTAVKKTAVKKAPAKKTAPVAAPAVAEAAV